MSTAEELRRRLAAIDGRGYKAYKALAGQYRFDRFILCLDHVQGDPYAAPSKLRLRVAAGEAGLPGEFLQTRVRRIAIEDFIARAIREALPHRGGRGSGRSGSITIDAGAQEVLERTAVRIGPNFVEARIEVGLPAAGRRILGEEAERILLRELPSVVDSTLLWKSLDREAGARFVATVENQEDLRRQLRERGLVAFVADGAILPRASGASEEPMAGAVPFRSPEGLRVELPLLHSIGGDSSLRGMGISEGVTLLVGGGYHGKSTLLRALDRGVYPHVPGDGREYTVTRSDAVKIRAEDGRHVSRADISGFIRDLPMGIATDDFSTEDASGSTSQAANIVEAIEAGSQLLLLDEDTSATNFLVRDARMQELVTPGEEPIVPFVDRVRELYRCCGVSTVLVMGGSGDYFDVADRVIRMEDFLPRDVTHEAKLIASSHPTGRRNEASNRPLSPALARRRRAPSESVDASRGKREAVVTARGPDRMVFGNEELDLRSVEQLVDPSQTRAAGLALHFGAERLFSSSRSLSEALDRLEEALDAQGLETLTPFGRRGLHPGNLARPRRFEIAAALLRLRSVTMEQIE